MNSEAGSAPYESPLSHPEGSVPRYVIAKPVPARQKVPGNLRKAACHFDFRPFFRLTVAIR